MTSEEYQKVKVVFQSVLEVEPDQQTAFLDDACRNNEDLRREVERFLGNYESGFMKETAIQNVFDISESKSLETGDNIGRFKILGKIGSGGMGEVYLAHDKSLGRDIAIKVLLSEFTSDKDRVNRFKLEAKAASALNHPNIITIYEIGEDDGKLFIATEQIKGETLRNLIQDKKLDITSSIRIAEQVASALNAAHSAGIIHRDIKPENIMVRQDGFVRVLDFGLAKPMTLDSEAATNELVATRKGMIMGSVGYMSPEQARGLKVDARTDLWSLGVVLYEMLTGNAPFHADTMTDVLANIIHKEPNPISEQIEAPTELYRIVKKSLRKEADERYQTAKDLSLDLKNLRREMELEHELELSVSPERRQEIRSRSNEIRETSDKDKETNELQETKIVSNPAITETSVEIAKIKSRYKNGILAMFGILLIGTIAYFGYGYLKWKSLSQTIFNNTTVEKLQTTGRIKSVAISPDGKYLAYVTNVPLTGMKLMLRQIETGSEKEIVSVKLDEFIYIIAFSPDGNYFYFDLSDLEGIRRLNKVALLGGEIKTIPIYADSTVSFSLDGKKIVFEHENKQDKTHNIITADIDGSNEKVVFSSQGNYLWSPKFSPDGSKIMLVYGNINEAEHGRKAKIGWISINGGPIMPFGNYEWDTIASGYEGEYVWLKDGSGIIVSEQMSNEQSLQIFKIDLSTGNLTRIVKDTNTYRGLTVTGDGNTLATIKKTTNSGLWEFDLTTKIAKQITPSTVQNIGVKGLAEFETDIFYVTHNGKGDYDLRRMSSDGSDDISLVSQKGSVEHPIVSSDGQYIYFTTNAESVSNSFSTNAVWRINSDGSKLKQLTTPSGVTQALIGVSPDNKALIVREWKGGRANSSIRKIDIETGEVYTIVENSEIFIADYYLYLPVSLNGKSLIYNKLVKSLEKDTEITGTTKLIDFDGVNISETTLKLPNESQVWLPIFAPEGKSIYYAISQSPSDIWQFDIYKQKPTKITNFNLDKIYNFTISRDGKKLYIVRGNTTDEIVLIKNVE